MLVGPPLADREIGEGRVFEEAFQQRAKSLRAKLIRQVTAKRESQSKEFPAYTAAHKCGFKDGLEPSDSEMQAEQNKAMQPIPICNPSGSR